MKRQTVVVTQDTTLVFPKGTEIPLDLLLLGQNKTPVKKRKESLKPRLGASSQVMIDRKLAATQKLAIKDGMAPKKVKILDALIEIPEDAKLTRASLTKQIAKKTKFPETKVSPWISTMVNLNVVVPVDS